MIVLRDVIEELCKSPICEGWLVGGVVERGWSNRDADLVVTNAPVAEGLPSYFDIIVQEKNPGGPSIPVAGLKAVLGFKFDFMKPTKTQGSSNEFYNINDFKNLKPGDYFVEPKYDGNRVQLKKAGYKVWILTDTGNDITDKLPNIAEEARTKIPFTVCILDCELAAYRGSQRLDHSGVAAFLHSTTPPEDYHLRLKPFDVLFYEGQDMRGKELADRKKLIARIPWGESIHPIKYKLVKADGVIATIEEMTTSEGAMIKDAASKYNSSGEGWYKWKKQYEIDAQVVAVDAKQDGFIYTCKVGDITIGDTYVTQVRAKVGDIITVSVDHITKKQDGSWGWYAPKVKELRDDKSQPDPVSVLQKILDMPSIENAKVVQSQPPSVSEAGKGADVTPATTAPAAKPGGDLPLSEGNFVLQEHWWGDKHHFDLRFEKKDSEGKPIMIGWTLLADSQKELIDKISSNTKILSKRKMYHDPKWLSFEGDIQPDNEGNPTKNFVAHMEIRVKGHYKFDRRQTDFVDVVLSGAGIPELNGRFYLRLVKLSKDSQGNQKSASEDTGEDWLFWMAKIQESVISRSVKFIAESFRVAEADTTAPSDEHVDIEITVISTNVTANGRQYTLEDLQQNATRLNGEGGLIFAMGKHPDNNEEPDAMDNVGLGKTFVRDSKLVSKATIFNTSTVPDMVRRIRLGLVRDVSIEGVAQKFLRVCDGSGCWQRAFGLTIHRAVFVSAGADPLAKIEKILESIEDEIGKNMTNGKDGAPASATVVVAESAPAKEAAASAGTAAVNVEKPTAVAGATIVVAEAPPASVKSTEAVAAPAAITPETKPAVTIDQVLTVCNDLSKMMTQMVSAISAMGTVASSATKESVPAAKEGAVIEAAKPAAVVAEAAKPAAVVVEAAATTVVEAAKPAVTESQGSPDNSGTEKPPKVKESQASPGNSNTSFYEAVKKLVR
jgi:ATP dependent DNA ligase domain